jgi:hypothetical protein
VSNYVQTTFFTPKDSLPVGNPAKVIYGAAYDVEFGNISTAIASKYDSLSLPSAAVTALTGTANQIIASASVGAITLSLAPNVIIPAPGSGSALTLSGAANSYGEQITGSATTGQSYGVRILAGTNSADNALYVTNEVNSVAFLQLSGDGHGLIGPITWTAGGAVSIPAPTSGNSLTISGGAAGAYSVIVQANSGASVSFGQQIQAGTNNADMSFSITNQAASTFYFRVFGDGGIAVGAPTGGDQGIGTLNTTGLFVNGVAVSTGLGIAQKAIKVAQTSRASTTTLANDPDLAIAIAAAGTYVIEVLFGAYNTAGATVGISFNLNYSGTFTQTSSLLLAAGFTNQGNLIQTAVTTSAFSGNCNTANGAYNVLKATLVATGAGTLGFAWAQVNTNPTGTIVPAGSYMTITKIA